jgi:alkylmercury lyase
MPASTHPPTVTELADALTAAVPAFDDQERQIVLATYRLLGEGSPVTDQRVATVVRSPVDDVARRLRQWSGVFRNDDGAIVGFAGLAIDALDPEYRLQRSDVPQPVYAWCAYDTLFLPARLGQTLEVTAADGHTGERIHLAVAPDGVRRTEPSDVVVSFLVPDGPFGADVIGSFCHKVLFFANSHNAANWIAAQRDELFSLCVDDAFEVGRIVNESSYGDALYIDRKCAGATLAVSITAGGDPPDAIVTG